MTATELQPAFWAKMSIAALRKYTDQELQIEIEAVKLKEAHGEVVEKLQKRGLDLDYSCGQCNSPLAEEMIRCWACGSTVDMDDEPEMAPSEVKERAEKLGVDTDGSQSDVEARIEEAETAGAKERKRGGDIGGKEAEALNQLLTNKITNGWKKNVSGQYTSYFDPNGKRRFVVFHRGLGVHFSVNDGDLDGVANLEFVDDKERRRRHFGRTNYVYTGEVAKDVVVVAERVIKLFS